MNSIVQTDRCTQTHAHIRMHAYAYKHKFLNVSVPLPFFVKKTTLTLLSSPLLHAERHALQAQLNLVPTERPYSVSLASLCRTGSPKPIKTSVAMHVTVLSMCSVQEKTWVIVPCLKKRGGGEYSAAIDLQSVWQEGRKTTRKDRVWCQSRHNLFHPFDFHVSRC